MPLRTQDLHTAMFVVRLCLALPHMAYPVRSASARFTSDVRLRRLPTVNGQR